jgi:hypothetical protein
MGGRLAHRRNLEGEARRIIAKISQYNLAPVALRREDAFCVSQLSSGAVAGIKTIMGK